MLQSDKTGLQTVQDELDKLQASYDGLKAKIQATEQEVKVVPRTTRGVGPEGQEQLEGERQEQQRSPD